MDTLGVLKVYTGQGFPSRGMGMDVLKAYPQVRELYATAKAITGLDVEQLCREGTDDEQTDTGNQQAMVFVNIAALILRTEGLLYDRNKVWHCPEHEEARDTRQSFYLGFSLGEILALLAARKFSFVDGMGVIDKRRKLMAREGKGELTNALGGEEAEIYRRISGKGVYLAISKSDGNISLGGYKTPLDLVCEELRAQGCVKKIIPNKKRLPAFHTPLFEEEADELLCSLREHSDIFLQSDRAVISNLDAQLFTGSVEDIIYRISRQMCRTVQFKRGQRSVEDRIEEIQVIGPGAKTMANIVKTNIPGMPVTTIETAESLDSYWTDRMRRLPSLTQY